MFYYMSQIERDKLLALVRHIDHDTTCLSEVWRDQQQRWQQIAQQYYQNQHLLNQLCIKFLKIIKFFKTHHPELMMICEEMLIQAEPAYCQMTQEELVCLKQQPDQWHKLIAITLWPLFQYDSKN